MPLPAPLSRRERDVHKNTFGHVLVLAGSARMLGAGALTSLAAMRAGAGLVTWGVPQSLNLVAQRKASNVVMTWPLAQTNRQTISFAAAKAIKFEANKYAALALGPGLTTHSSTVRFILEIISAVNVPMVLDADSLNALHNNLGVLQKSSVIKILTPHPGEFLRLTQISKSALEKDTKAIVQKFAKGNNCVVLLKGHKTLVCSSQGKIYTNQTGNAGMATAGSGDVLTGIIAAFLAQGLDGFSAACLGARLHGLAGDWAAKNKTKLSLIASDIIDYIPKAIKEI